MEYKLKPFMNTKLHECSHALECKKQDECEYKHCPELKSLFSHFNDCKNQSDCISCNGLNKLLYIHSNNCNYGNDCKFPKCSEMKESIQFTRDNIDFHCFIRVSKHSMLCIDNECLEPFCHKMKQLLEHSKRCSRTNCNQCKLMKNIIDHM